MLIMYLLGMLFHPANVSSLTFALEVKSCSALCDDRTPFFEVHIQYNPQTVYLPCAQRAEQDLTQSEKVRDETFTG